MIDIKKLLKEFASETTCHGPAQIAKQKRTVFHRIIWLTLMLGLTSGMIWQLKSKIQEYTEYPTSTSIQEKYKTELDFPEVTICNYNRFFGIESALEVQTLDTLIEVSSPYKPHGNYSEWWTQEVDLYYKELRKQGNKTFLLSDELKSKGWVLNDTSIKKCSFRSKACSIKNFKRILTPMGICYTFAVHDVIQTIPGSGNGLVLVLDINQERYATHPHYGFPGAGVKVHVHGAKEPPLIQNFGVSVPSGHCGHIVMQRTQRKLMNPPWGICSKETTKLRHFSEYSTAACYIECRTDYVIKRCGCKPYWAPVKRYEVEECNALQILDCAGEVESQFMSKITMSKCGCVTPCEFVTYETKVTYSTFPSVQIGQHLISPNNLKVVKLSTGRDFTKAIEEVSVYRENYLMLDIYFDSLSDREIIQSKSVSEISLICDIGGLLGLWVGISFVTVFEFFQLFVAIICGAGATTDDSKNTQIETGLITQKDTFSTRMLSSKQVEKFDCLTLEPKS
ncbi:bile acid-sensitive ion channel-like [Clavelina lepadiformis]|uniref:bile acid-sensitive ion channel-like n=1 Tax=Clavelina lepadiformis TaxID=159417 RepID=UPI0040412B80